MIFAQVNRAVARLTPEQQNDVYIVGVTMDPENDDIKQLKTLANSQRIGTPQFHLLTGDPSDVNDVLDHMGIERRWNAETKVIDHTNLFLLVDRSGRVAYRFSLGELQENWMVEALQILYDEPEPQR